MTRTYLTSVLLNLPVITTETSVANLLVLIDHFIENPDEYKELLNSRDYDVLVFTVSAALAQDSTEPLRSISIDT